MVTFLFSVHTITEAKQYAGLGRVEPGLEPGRWIFQPFELAYPGVVPPLHILARVYALLFFQDVVRLDLSQQVELVS